MEPFEALLDSPEYSCVNATTKRRILTAFQTLDTGFLDSALGHDNVSHGFSLSGVWPFSPSQILARVPGITTMPSEVGKVLQAGLNQVLDHAK